MVFRSILVLFFLSGVSGAAAVQPARRPLPPPGEGPGPEDGPRGQFRRGAPDGPGEGPGGRGPVPWQRLAEPEKARLKRFVEEHFPRLAVEMDKLRQTSPQRFERRMTRIAMEMRRLMEVMERDPGRGTAMIRERQVAFQIHQLAMEYHESKDDAQRENLREKLEEAVTSEFQVRMARRAEEVREMETQLVELKGRLSEMKSLRDDLIDRRVRELLEKPRPSNRPRQASADESDDDKMEPKPPSPDEQR